MNKTQMYARDLRRTLGPYRALKVAERCMKENSPSNWTSLPKGTVFYTKDKRSQTHLDVRHLNKVYNYWVEVFNLLRKES